MNFKGKNRTRLLSGLYREKTRLFVVVICVSIIFLFALYRYNGKHIAKDGANQKDRIQWLRNSFGGLLNMTSSSDSKQYHGVVQKFTRGEHRNVGLPKIIHQVWTDDIVPNEFVDNVKGLIKLNPAPEWKYYFWTQKSGRLLMERKYPSLMKLFDVSDNTQKADIIRLLAIHQYGGAYFDMDTVAVKPLQPFFDNATCSIVPHPPEDYIDKDSIIRPILISNNVLLCNPFHPFYDELIRRLEKQPLTCIYAVQCTGPFFVSHVYDVLRQKSENFGILPKWVSYELFQDKIPTGALSKPNRVCNGKAYNGAEVWRREMCDEWRRRGGSSRNISEKAYTYHTWFHVRTHKVKSDPKNQIKNVVPHVTIYV